MILVVGTLYDEMTELMCARLQQLKFGHIYVDTEKLDLLKFTWSTLEINDYLKVQLKKVYLKDVSGIYCRYVNLKKRSNFPGMLKTESGQIRTEALSALINFVDRSPAVVVNKLRNSFSNESKTFQQITISKAGFMTPKTLVTNCPEQVFEFYRSCNNKIIFKSNSCIRSIVTKFSPKHFKSAGLIKNCPVHFQEMIEGTDVRVHTIRDKVFATAIKSDAVDYRYAGRYRKPVQFCSYKLPEEISNACVQLTKDFGLEISGIDLKQTANGDFYCFEVNPSPGFIAYERMTGQAISKEVAYLLKNDL
ncbi:MAG: RimK domain-containing protein ATP-grasp [Ignavibacteria bacterium]